MESLLGKRSALHWLSLSLAGLVLAACGSQVNPAPRAMPPVLGTPAPQAILDFTGGISGSYPNGALLFWHGMLWGASSKGGYTDCECGVVFGLDPEGKQSPQIYPFYDDANGSKPNGDLIEVDGKIYGTAESGSREGSNGVVFQIDPSTHERRTMLRLSGTNGSAPKSGLVAFDGQLYGTASGGGAAKKGTVFSLPIAGGNARLVYSFTGGKADGGEPIGGLVAYNDKLYGTTVAGGASQAGTVYEIARDGKERTVYAFDPRSRDGILPQSSLIALRGQLYGTALIGGAHNLGALFAVDPLANTERVIFSFSSLQGSRPSGRLLNVDGSLYGTAQSGGSFGGGAVFAVHSNGGLERDISLKKPVGVAPRGGITVTPDGVFYGVAHYGGTHDKGTIFTF
jgi:uncharacterized repeat protein (TIGR03803 family)